jgi:hypothetical protein
MFVFQAEILVGEFGIGIGRLDVGFECYFKVLFWNESQVV